jgi:hypothetical protein
MARGVVQATQRKDGPGALAQLVAGALQAESIVQPATREHSSGGGGVRLLATCGCIGTTCTYENCSPAGVSGVVVDGTFSFTDDHLVCTSLRYQTVADGANVAVTLDCDVVVASDRMNGYVRTSGSMNLAGLVTSTSVTLDDIEWSSDTRLDDVTFDDRGPTGGSARVDATFATGTQTYTGSAAITFR